MKENLNQNTGLRLEHGQFSHEEILEQLENLLMGPRNIGYDLLKRMYIPHSKIRWVNFTGTPAADAEKILIVLNGHVSSMSELDRRVFLTKAVIQILKFW